MIPAALHLTVVHQLRVLCTIKIIMCARVRACVCTYIYYMPTISLLLFARYYADRPANCPPSPSLAVWSFFSFVFVRKLFHDALSLRCVYVLFHRVLLRSFFFFVFRSRCPNEWRNINVWQLQWWDMRTNGNHSHKIRYAFGVHVFFFEQCTFSTWSTDGIPAPSLGPARI